MSDTKRSGGIGRKIFTTPTGDTPATEPSAAAAAGIPQKPPKPKVVKARTTVMLYPQTLSAMEQLKVELRKSGDKVTLSDVLEQAVWALMEKKGLKP